MIWTKNLDNSANWGVYHFGFNGGTNPQNYYMGLNLNSSEGTATDMWNNTAPTSIDFSIGNSSRVNQSPHHYLAMLFTSVTGISKCGYYNGSNSDQTITLGFQPRFFLAKATDGSGSDYKWAVLDSNRGLVGSTRKALFMDESSDGQEGHWVYSVSSTGITLKGLKSPTNMSGKKYIYYAHA